MEDELNKSASGEWLDDLTWARDLAVRLVGEAFADDVLQEARMAAWNAGGAQGAPSRPWLHVVVKRFALQVMRSEGARKRREQSVARRELLPSPTELSERLEQQQRIASAVAALTEPYRSTILLRYSEGLEPTEIARRQGIPAGTVRWRLKSALDQLRATLDEQNGGERQAWMVGFAPLLRAPSSAPVPLTATGVGIAVGSFVMKKWLAAAAVVVFVGLGWQRWTALETGSQPLALGPERELELPTMAFAEQPLVPARNARVAVPAAIEKARVKDAAATQTQAPGWWLMGRVAGIPAGESGATTLHVVGSQPGKSESLDAGVADDGSVRVDLAKIFDGPALLPKKLRVTLRHPGRLDAVQTWDVDRDQRQAGFISGERTVFELQLELTDPFGSLTGEVHVPEGISAQDVRVVLVPVGEAEPDPCLALDMQPCDANGRFTLALAQPGRYHVIAHHQRKLLRPSFLVLDATGGINELPEAIELAEGAVLQGRATVNGGTPGFRLELDIKNPRIKNSFCQKSRGLRWFEGQYHESRRTWKTDESGAFRITGLSAGEQNLQIVRLGLEGEWIHLSRGPGVTLSASANAPNLSTAVDFGFHVVLFECTSNSRALPGVQVKIAYKGGSMSSGTGLDGRVAFAYSPKGPESTIEFRRRGYEPVNIPLERHMLVPQWERIELQQLEGTGAALLLELTGDNMRGMERFSIQILARDQSPNSELEAWQTSQWKRTTHAPRITGIPPGSYRITILPDDPSNSPGNRYPDTASTVWAEPVEVQLADGEQRTLQIPLHVGGRLWLQAAAPKGSPGEKREGGVGYRVVDARGETVPSHWVSQSGLRSSIQSRGGLALGDNCFLEPPLPVGNYTLEIWARIGEGNVRRFPFAISSGEITRLYVDDPR